MRLGASLRLRLSLAAAALIALALLLGGAGIFVIFDQALDRRTADELDHSARFLAGEVTFDAKGALALERTPADPRYATPYGGLYWQVEAAGRTSARSRSLWDKDLKLPPDTRAGTVDLAAPDGGRLIAVVRTVQLKTPAGAPPAVITVAMDRSELAESRARTLWLLAFSLAALALVLSLAMAVFIHRALAPFRALRADLAEAHEGRGSRLKGGYAGEVQPLIDDLNRLLDQQDKAMERARAEAGDMAHGLKTPLAVLDALARRIEPAEPELAREIDEQSEAMRRQAARSLARARSAGAVGLTRRQAPVAPVVAELVSALRRLPGSAALDWRVELEPGARCPVSDGDLLEMLGALVDNARKWATGTIVIGSSSSASEVAVSVEDDGPGMAEPDATAIARGRRWDEGTPGTGFGLAITRDLAEATGGRLELSRSNLGGLRAAIVWPVKA